MLLPGQPRTTRIVGAEWLYRPGIRRRSADLVRAGRRSHRDLAQRLGEVSVVSGNDRAERLFEELTEDYRQRRGVVFGRMMSSDGLRVNGKIFAMLVRGRLVVKVPAERAADLIDRGAGQAFEPRPGRRMREWVVLDVSDDTIWPDLTAEAFDYVSTISGR